MALKNTLQTLGANKEEDPKRFSEWLARVENKNSITSMVGDINEAGKFISNISSVVAISPQLRDCSFPTVVSAGLLANSLKLSMSPSIGHCYLIPFDDSKNNRKVATFVLGWKGYLQLAQRSGYYEQINVVEIKEGEVEKIDAINEIYTFKPIEDDDVREKTSTVGYYAFFRYNKEHGGFFKAIYWSKKKMLAHADKYSKAFHAGEVKADDPRKSRVSYEDFLAGKYPKSDAWKYSSFWYASFDEMAKKTMIRQLIGKWGIMSVDFQKAYEADNSFNDDFSDDAKKQYTEDTDNDIVGDSNIVIGDITEIEEAKEDIVSETEQAEDKLKRGRRPSVSQTFFDE